MCLKKIFFPLSPQLGTDKAEGSGPRRWELGARASERLRGSGRLVLARAGLGRSGPSAPSGCALRGSVCTGSTRAGRRGSGRKDQTDLRFFVFGFCVWRHLLGGGGRPLFLST